ncbi:hypothetical protein JVU11DRAFT_11386 [Chiua virens]|nr:hypothetical protein JVU11DRAFT_11386 [Chiua virens]
MVVNSQTTTFTGSYADHWLILRYCGHHIKIAVDVLQKGALNDHCWTNFTAELQLLNHIYAFGMLNGLFMQLPQVAWGALTLVTDSDNFTNNLQTFVLQLPVDNDNTDLSFDTDWVDMVWWTAELAPLPRVLPKPHSLMVSHHHHHPHLAMDPLYPHRSLPLPDDYYLIPFEELWRQATIAHRADDPFTIADTSTKEQVIDTFQWSLTDVFQKLKVEWDNVELEMAVVNEQLKAMESMFGSHIL